jgi:hypothetical protein
LYEYNAISKVAAIGWTTATAANSVLTGLELLKLEQAVGIE